MSEVRHEERGGKLREPAFPLCKLGNSGAVSGSAPSASRFPELLHPLVCPDYLIAAVFFCVVQHGIRNF